MGFASNGVYTPATGAENAYPGKVIASATWNAVFSDIANALTDLAQYAAFEFVFDQGSVVISPGLGGYLRVPFAGTIQRVSLFSTVVTTSVVDIWKVPYASFPPSVATSVIITSGAAEFVKASES